MKKITITIALLLVVALAMPAFGASFTDVPSNHWAYDAINKLVSSGVINGYPDGTFRGDQDMTRYEMAVMISRALDNIADEQAALEDKVDDMGNGLTTAQAQDVSAIVKALIDRNMPEQNDELTDNQADEVVNIVKALTFEFKAELKVLGAEIDALGEDMAALEDKVDAMDVPEDNVEFGVTVDSIFEVASYKDENAEDVLATMVLWADGDALDLDMPVASVGSFDDVVDENITPDQYIADLSAGNESDWGDADDFPSEKRFWQEYNINVKGDVGGASFMLDLDAFANVFSEEDSAFGYAENDARGFEMDDSLLTIGYADTTVLIGDQDDYGVAKYFLDDEDIQGLEVKTNYLGADWKFLVAGYGDGTDDDVYGATVTKDMDFGTLTGNVYQARLSDRQISVVGVGLADVSITDAVTVGGKFAFNDNSATDSDTFVSANAEFAATDELTINGMVEMAGEDFDGHNDDLESDNKYMMYKVGADYILNENNSLSGSYALTDDDLEDEDESTIEASLDNVMGNFTNTASLEYIINDGFDPDHETRIISLGTEYAWNETTTLGAALVNKNDETDGSNNVNYNYLKGTMSKELTDVVTWDTEAKYILGDVGEDEVEGEGSALTTSLSVSF